MVTAKLLDVDDRTGTLEVAFVESAVNRRAFGLVAGILLVSVAAFAGATVCSFTYPVVLGNALLAFVLGLRHAVDCDHLAAIDNVTRQLVLMGQRPVSVGCWFALGHSTIVVVITGALASGYSALQKPDDGESAVREGLTLAAAIVSVLLLGGIGLLNARVAIGLFQEWARLRGHSAWFQDQALEETATESLRSALTSVPFLKRIFGRVDRPEKMYLVGALFGLSFDTATQVGLIALAAMTGTSGRLPPLVVLLFPICFSCGMCLVDTLNGLLMLMTYSWATVRPMQKLKYNMLVTALSAAVALAIGSLETLQIVGREARLKGDFWGWIQDVNMGDLGCAIMSAFFVVLLAGVCGARLCRACAAEAEAAQDFEKGSCSTAPC